MRLACAESLAWLLLAAGGLGLWGTAVARGHPGQHLGLKISITDEEVALEVLLSNDYAKRLVPLESYAPEYSTEEARYHFPDSAQEVRMRRAYEEFLGGLDTVEIDRLPVKPILERVEFVPAADALGVIQPEEFAPDVGLRLTYPCKGRPKLVSIVWELFGVDPVRAAAGLPSDMPLLAELEAYAERRLVVFTAEEPEVIWHAPAGSVAERVQPVVTAVTPLRIPIPLVSLGVVLVWVLGLLGLRAVSVRRAVRRSVWWCSVVPLALAVYFHNVAVVSVASPWGERVQLPGEQEATEIFVTLHRNVYRAFDYKTESDVYDILAQSVAGDLLDQVYNEVYQSLIMRDQGGAVARVHSVDVLDTEVLSAGRLPDSGALAFRLRARWQVYGVVAHWGHFHSRTNEYEALYTVAQLDDAWKIVGVEVLEQRRVDADDENPKPEEQQP
jgi:hypothetical protein